MKTKTFNSLAAGHARLANKAHKSFVKSGVNFATGVPCGVLKHIIRNLNNDQRILHIPVNRESEAVGLAAGAYFAGKTPIVYMQNSGLFAASNDIASLLIPYKIPVFFVVSYRGCQGEDAVQHLATGQATESLIRSFELPFKVFERHVHNLDTLISTMFRNMNKLRLPEFLLLKRGWCI